MVELKSSTGHVAALTRGCCIQLLRTRDWRYNRALLKPFIVLWEIPMQIGGYMRAERHCVLTQPQPGETSSW